jgi:ATP-dependent helicase HrpA
VALTLQPADIYARTPDPQLLEQFPQSAALEFGAPAGGAAQGPRARLRVPIDYRFMPGDAHDGALIPVPLLALPSMTRAALDAAVPGLAVPHVEALLRSLPKEARRALIPVSATARGFMEFMGAPCTDTLRLARWLAESRGLPKSLIRLDRDAVPAHLVIQVAVSDAVCAGAGAGAERVRGGELGALRRRCAAAARAELDRRAGEAHPAPWRRFEQAEIEDTVAIDVGEGVVHVFPTLAQVGAELTVRYEWSREEAARRWRQAAPRLARLMLARQARDLAKTAMSDSRLLLAASPYLPGAGLLDVVLQLAFRRACFQESEPPRTRAAFDAAVEAGRERLYAAFEQVVGGAAGWFAAARAVRRLLDEPRARSHAAAAEESHAHLRRLLSADSILEKSEDWLRQFPRYLKAEERRWERLFARGSEAAGILDELQDWHARAQYLEAQVSAELRRLAQLDELHAWIEEYRVSLYAQELRTQGPVSAARLAVRAAEVEAWITR